MTPPKKSKERGNGEGTVWKSGKGYRWQFTVGYTAAGKRIARSGRADDKKSAMETRDNAKTDYSRGLLGDPTKITVAEYARCWQNRKVDVKAQTVQQYAGELDYALEHIGKMQLQAVRAYHLKEVMVAMSRRRMKTGTTMAPRTQGRVLMLLRAVFREAVSDQFIYVNPTDGVRRVKGAISESAGEALDFDQMARLHTVGTALYAAGMFRLWPAVFTAASVGLRRSEVMGLEWQHVDFEQAILRIRQGVVVGVKGMELSNLKTKGSRRDIYLPPSLMTVLKEHKTAQEKERQTAGSAWAGTGMVFATTLGGWTSPDNLHRAVKMLVRWSDPALLERPDGKRSVWQGIAREKRAALMAAIRAGEKLPNISPHDLRHTYATLALRRRVPVEVVSKVLGHARVSITLDVYRHVMDNEQRALVVDLFDSLPSAPSYTVPALN